MSRKIKKIRRVCAIKLVYSTYLISKFVNSTCLIFYQLKWKENYASKFLNERLQHTVQKRIRVYCSFHISLSNATSSFILYDMRQRFLCSQKRNFILIRQKTKNFPIDPHYKNHPICNVMSIDMTLQKWAIFIMGVYGEI